MTATRRRYPSSKHEGPESGRHGLPHPLLVAAAFVCTTVAALALVAGAFSDEARAQFTPSTIAEGSEGVEGAQGDLPQASPGDSLADERRENGDLDSVGARQTGEQTGSGGEPTSALPSEAYTTSGPVAPEAANTPTGGADVLGGPAWLIGAMFALGAAAAVIVVALRRMPASGASVGSGEIFEKTGRHRR